MPIAKQPDLNKALKYRARLDGCYEVGVNGVLLQKPVEGPHFVMEGETRVIELDCTINLLKDSCAFVSYHPDLYKMGTITGPSILADKENRVTLRIEADVDIDLIELPYVAKVIFEGIY